MSFGWPNLKKLTGALLALLIAGAVVWAAFRPGKPAPVEQVVVLSDLPVTSGGTTLKPVDLPVALLFDCYENALENVPPRTDTSKRQWSWEAPPLPMEVARRELTKAGASESDKKVLAWLEDWEFGWKKDYPTTTDQLWRLDSFFKDETSMSAIAMLNMGIALSFLDGDEHAAFWMKRVFDTQQDPPQDHSSNIDFLIDKYAQTRALWQRREYSALESRFRRERKLRILGSRDSMKANVLVGETQFMRGYYVQAAATFAEASIAKSKSWNLLDSDQSEISWLIGFSWYLANRPLEARSYLEFVSQDHQSGHQRQAAKALMIVYAKVENPEEIQSRFLSWKKLFNPSSAELAEVQPHIDAANGERLIEPHFTDPN